MRGWQSAEWGISANEKQREGEAGEAEDGKKESEGRLLEEYSGRGEGKTGAVADAKVNYHITGHFVLLIFRNSCTFVLKAGAKYDKEAGL